MRIALAVLGLWAMGSAVPPTSGVTEPVAVRVAPAQTWVSLASVHLALSDLRPQGEELVGDFAIRVPLLPSKDDHGTVSLRMDAPLEACLRQGTTLVGKASSRTTGQVNAIRCSVEPDGRVRIAVTTPHRTLKFASRYTVVR